MGFFSSGLQANPRDPASRTVLILAGGFSDPSTWARGRLKSTFRGAWSATALSFPKTALPRAACPMSHAAPRTNQTPFALPTGPGGCADWRTGEARGACCTAAGSECHAGVTSSSQRSETERGEGRGQHRGRLPTAVSHGWAAPNPDGKPNRALDRQHPDSEPVRLRERIDSVPVSNGTARITVYIVHIMCTQHGARMAGGAREEPWGTTARGRLAVGRARAHTNPRRRSGDGGDWFLGI